MFVSGLCETNIRKPNQVTIKQFGSSYKVTILRSVRVAGYEETFPNHKNNSHVNSDKLCNNLSRARNAVFEYAMCNPWSYFATFTINSNFDRYDLSSVYKAFSKWINNFNQRNGVCIKYLIIPEQHKDGAWHFHGLINGLHPNYLVPFSLSDNIPLKLKLLIENGRIIYNWPAYSKHFGFVTLEKIQNIEACSKYITKYITKSFEPSCIGLNKHLYYCSHGLKRAEVLFRGDAFCSIDNPDFSNDYVQVKFVNSLENAKKYIYLED